MVLDQKLPFFHLFFCRQYSIRKCPLRYSRTKKRLSRLTQKEVQNNRKIDSFSKGLIHGFGLKMAIFPTFFLGNIDQENVFYDILERKNTFLGYKKRGSKSRKIDIFPKGWPMVLEKKWPFFQHIFFRQYRPRKCLLRYSTTKKHLSRL